MDAEGADESVVVGRFNGPWGVQGWVRVYSHTRPATAIFDYRPWLVGEQRREMAVETWRQAGPRLVARIQDVDSREAAAALAHHEIRVPRSSLPEPEPGHYYWHDLIGLEVVHLDGHSHGHVRSMIETGSHDVLEVSGRGQAPILIPFVVGTFVRRVDIESGRITVDWPREWMESGDD